MRGGSWFVDAKERDDLKACADIDLEATPATNTIPIRRIPLKVGQKMDFTAAWVRFPSLRIRRLEQSYERLGPREYLYRASSGFSAKLEVDTFGLITSYEGIWEKL